jgi:hypothetical protein
LHCLPADLQIVRDTYIAMMKSGVLEGNGAFQAILSLAMNTTANVREYQTRNTSSRGTCYLMASVCLIDKASTDSSNPGCFIQVVFSSESMLLVSILLHGTSAAKLSRSQNCCCMSCTAWQHQLAHSNCCLLLPVACLLLLVQATFFWPVDTAWGDLSQQLCMSIPQIQNVMVSFPPIAASFMSLIVVPGRTLFERDFKNGEELPTLNSTFTLPLTRRSGP